MKVASLFSGCGGLDLGFKKAGFDIVWANDIDVDSCKTYQNHIGDHVVVGDIKELINSIPSVDLIIGGPPCQSFSLVGKRLEDDERSSLVISFFQAVGKIMPKAFLMENVPGLSSSKFNNEKIPDYLARKFKLLGYKTFLTKVKAIDYCVPQKRERVILIGFKKGVLSKEFKLISPEKFKNIIFENEKTILPISVFEALNDLGDVNGSLKNDGACPTTYKNLPHSPYSKLMREGNENDLLTLHVLPTMSQKDRDFVKFIPPGGNYMNIPDEIATQRIMKFKQTGGRTTTYARLHPEKPSYTVNTYFNRPNVGSNYHYEFSRLISPREGLRLQSFPDYFTPHFSTQRSLFMQIGNAVPPLMAHALAESIKEAINA